MLHIVYNFDLTMMRETNKATSFTLLKYYCSILGYHFYLSPLQWENQSFV